jgi:hypothetical protein
MSVLCIKQRSAPERIRVDEFRFFEALRLGSYLTTPTLSDCPGRSEARWLCHSRTTPTASEPEVVPDGYTPRHWALFSLPSARSPTALPPRRSRSSNATNERLSASRTLLWSPTIRAACGGVARGDPAVNARRPRPSCVVSPVTDLILHSGAFFAVVSDDLG